MKKSDNFEPEMENAKKLMVDLKAMNKERNANAKSLKVDGRLELSFKKNLSNFEKTFGLLTTTIGEYDKYKSSNDASWPFKEKPTSADLDKRRADYNVLKREIEVIKNSMADSKLNKQQLSATDRISDLIDGSNEWDPEKGGKDAHAALGLKSDTELIMMQNKKIQDQEAGLDEVLKVVQGIKFSA